MTKPITDKAEVALEYPDKLYVGTFERSSRFEARLDPTGIALILERPGADDVHKSIHMHINFGLFADILRELASTVGRIPKDDIMHRDQLAKAVAELHSAPSQSLAHIASETDATKCILIAGLLTKEEAEAGDSKKENISSSPRDD
jgi:hypothetical protein